MTAASPVGGTPTDSTPDNPEQLAPDLLPDNLADIASAESRATGPEAVAEPALEPLPVVDLDHVGGFLGVAGPAIPVTAAGDAEVAPTDAGADQGNSQGPPTIWEQMGGPMGMVDSGLPVVVFIVANAVGGLGWGIGAALSAAVLIAIMRIARKRPVTQAIAGVFGVGIAAFIAYKTDSAKGYFLLGIWSYLLYGGALLVSMLVRRPLIGVIWEGINGRGSAWRVDRKLVRRYDYATFVWVLVFAARYLVQNYLYDTDQVGWLAAVRLLMGYPVFILAIAISVWIVAGGSAVSLPTRLTRRRTDAR